MVLVVVIIVMVMVMMTAADGAGLFLGKGVQIGSEGGSLLHCGENLCAAEIVPRRGNDDRLGILFPQERYGVGDLLLGAGLGVAEDDSTCVLDLIVVELTEVLDIHLALVGVGNGSVAVQYHIVGEHGLHGADDVGELPHARGLNEDTIGSVFLYHLRQCFGEVAHQRTADAAGVHFVDGDACVLQEAAVDADLAEFVFDEDDFLSGVGFGQEFFDQGSLAGSQKAGEYINFGHCKSEPFL